MKTAAGGDPDMMTTHEVAAYLRIKERKVYDLVRAGRIPCVRVTGKWLFPRERIDAWMAGGAGGPEAAPAAAAPPVIAGSHDPLLDWAVRESGSALALMSGGSMDGIARMAAGEASACGLHVLDGATGSYNVAAVEQGCAGLDAVLIEWAWRDQGLVVVAGNPLGLKTIADLKAKRARVAVRQEGAGARILFSHLCAQAGVAESALDLLPRPARSETDLGAAVHEGKADAGIAIAAVARSFGLDFVPLARERYDLLVRRREYFEPPMQALLSFARTEPFAERARDLGYDVSGLGKVVRNL